jgi:hypothetical protein
LALFINLSLGAAATASRGGNIWEVQILNLQGKKVRALIDCV